MYHFGERDSTYRNPVVPKRNIPLVPLKPSMNLGTSRHNLSQETDNMIRLRLRHTNDLGYESRVKEDALPARDGVRPNEWVLGGDGLATYCSAKVA